MISDILSDASAEITRYLTELPECYSEPAILAQILAVQRHMDNVRILLDTPPVVTQDD